VQLDLSFPRTHFPTRLVHPPINSLKARLGAIPFARAKPDHAYHLLASLHEGADIQREHDAARSSLNNRTLLCQSILDRGKLLASGNALPQSHVRRQQALHRQAHGQIIPADRMN
jgi:hypothetical protein